MRAKMDFAVTTDFDPAERELVLSSEIF